jgi:hypothetical protein
MKMAEEPCLILSIVQSEPMAILITVKDQDRVSNVAVTASSANEIAKELLRLSFFVDQGILPSSFAKTELETP